MAMKPELAERQSADLQRVEDRKVNQLKRRLNQAGQGMVEYILIIGLVALLIFAAVQLFGKDINNLFNKANSDLSNVSGAATGP